MSTAAGIARLGGLADRLRRDGSAAAADVVSTLRDVERAAREGTLAPLASSCRAGADALARLADGRRWEQHAPELLAYLDRVAEFGARCAQALAAGADVATLPPPAAPAARDGDEERQYAEAVAQFVSQAAGVAAELEAEILALEGNTRPGDAIAGIRRTIHTLKAEFGVLGVGAAQALCHQAETAIDACVERQAPFPVDAMLQCVDALKQLVERLARGSGEPADTEPVLHRLREIAAAASATAGAETIVLRVAGGFADCVGEFATEARAHLADAETAMVALANEPGDVDHLDLTFRAFHSIKGVAAFLGLAPLVEFAHSAEALLDACRERRGITPDEIDLILGAGDTIHLLLQSLEGQPGPLRRDGERLLARLHAAAAAGAGTRAAAVPPPPPPAAPPAARPEQREPAVAAPAREAEAVLAPRPPVAPAANEPNEPKIARVERTVKVATARLDLLVDMVGELVVAQSMVLQHPAVRRLDDTALVRSVGQVAKITRDLQEAAMALRMVPVKATFQKMARLVRDVAAKAGKKVAFTLLGEDTEVDRNVVEQISDPLVHMIRNAIDHGIEPPHERAAAGKDPEGRLTLAAYHQGGAIVVEVRDDGRGLDRERIVRKAVEKGLVPSFAAAAQLDDARVHELIFLPGFSTAAAVTDLSGRGVGMDVVRRNVETLRGKVEIANASGRGTTFRMRLPLTLAIIDGMVVRVGASRYVLPTLCIEHSFRADPAQLVHVVERAECVRVRDAVLPLHRLKRLLGQHDGTDDVERGIVVVVEADGRRVCLLVDDIVGQQQVVVKSLGMPRERLKGLSGGAIMTDGRVALILDVPALVDGARAQPQEVA